jgi:hypothetical protein
VIWAAAVTHSLREYRKDRVRESADAIAAEAEVLSEVEQLAEIERRVQPNQVAPLVDGPDAVRAGRPQAPGN